VTVSVARLLDLYVQHGNTIVLIAGMVQALAAAEPFRDLNLPLERRVDDLVSRLKNMGML
jgi:hypothetical protein